jgi:hypothetical protein
MACFSAQGVSRASSCRTKPRTGGSGSCCFRDRSVDAREVWDIQAGFEPLTGMAAHYDECIEPLLVAWR